MTTAPLWLAVLSSALITGLAASALTLYVQARNDRRAMKRDVLRRLAGHRQLFMVDTGPIPVNDEPIVSLNEAFVVFADDQEVLKALQRLRDNAAADPDDVVALIKRMATAANVPINVDDAFIGEPFVPLAPREPAGR